MGIKKMRHTTLQSALKPFHKQPFSHMPLLCLLSHPHLGADSENQTASSHPFATPPMVTPLSHAFKKTN